jgi:hypothetical protein
MPLTSYENKVTDTHLEYAHVFINGTIGYANAPQCYVYRYIACLVKSGTLDASSQRRDLLTSTGQKTDYTP